MVVLMTRLFTRFNFFVALMGTTAAFGGAALAARQGSPPQVVTISAERFSFTPSEFRVKAGQPVEIRLRSDDTDHGFRILDTDVNVIVPKRGRGEVTVVFAPPKPGRYVFECSKLCGAGHSFMRGTLIAE
jgi:cytochrome c oxidase subunit 2